MYTKGKLLPEFPLTYEYLNLACYLKLSANDLLKYFVFTLCYSGDNLDENKKYYQFVGC